jgi:hypothetical protein
MTDRSHEKLVSVTLQFQGFSATAHRLQVVARESELWLQSYRSIRPPRSTIWGMSTPITTPQQLGHMIQ